MLCWQLEAQGVSDNRLLLRGVGSNRRCIGHAVLKQQRLVPSC